MTLEPKLLAEDKDLLEDLLAAAINDLNGRIEEAVQARMSSLTGGLSLPDGIKLPF